MFLLFLNLIFLLVLIGFFPELKHIIEILNHDIPRVILFLVRTSLHFRHSSELTSLFLW